MFDLLSLLFFCLAEQEKCSAVSVGGVAGTQISLFMQMPNLKTCTANIVYCKECLHKNQFNCSKLHPITCTGRTFQVAQKYYKILITNKLSFDLYCSCFSSFEIIIYVT